MKLICGIVGSLRQGSFNRGLMNAAIELGRGVGLDMQIFDRLDTPRWNAMKFAPDCRADVLCLSFHRLVQTSTTPQPFV